MEEKVVGGKEKKYVLYTVVGEERGKAGAGVWVVRVLLGTLLLVALAVVPYLSLRLAQVSDRTLVVFQPVPMRNHSLHHHHNDHHKDDKSKTSHLDAVGILQSASLTLENHTAEATNASKSLSSNATSNSTIKNKTNGTSQSNSSNSSSGGIVTLHESAVTLAVMEDTNATKRRDNNTDGDDTEHEEDSDKTQLEVEKKGPEENATTEDSETTTEPPVSVAQPAAASSDASPSTPPATPENTPASSNKTVAPHVNANSTTAHPSESTAATTATPSAVPESVVASNTSAKESAPKVSNVSSSPSTAAPNTTISPSTTTSTSTHHALAHKLVYVATTASGNHVGGFCVWKTDKTITRWSYFYENIPIEYQSHQDSADHEMRGMLAAVRTWAPFWNDHHVVLRSHHASIKGSDHPTRHALTRELEKLSEGHFSYELEWRLRKTDRVVDIAYCLARLHRDYDHWYRTFNARVDELLGPQDWAVAKTKNRAAVSQESFLTDDPEDGGVLIPGAK